MSNTPNDKSTKFRLSLSLNNKVVIFNRLLSLEMPFTFGFGNPKFHGLYYALRFEALGTRVWVRFKGPVADLKF